MTEAITIVDITPLGMGRAPETVLEEAHRAAAALKKVIDAKPDKDKLMFGPKGKEKQYLVFEDWQTVGRFYGIAPRIVSDKYVTYGAATGWEATAEAVHIESGRVISSANAMCLDDEDKWNDRPKYVWVYHKKSGGTSETDPGRDELIWEKGLDGKNRPKKERVLLGQEPVPMFQLRSMAQTRAGAKALRNALAWVVVLAGYAPTPAEEMEDDRTHGKETIDAVADTPDEASQRAALIASILARKLELRLSDKDWLDYKRKRLGAGELSTCDLAALQDLKGDLAGYAR